MADDEDDARPCFDVREHVGDAGLLLAGAGAWSLWRWEVAALAVGSVLVVAELIPALATAIRTPRGPG